MLVDWAHAIVFCSPFTEPWPRYWVTIMERPACFFSERIHGGVIKFTREFTRGGSSYVRNVYSRKCLSHYHHLAHC